MSDRSTPPREPTGQSLWGGRFSAKPADIMQAINVSIGVDKRLWEQDIAGSRAHCRMLAAQRIIPTADADAILGGLDTIEGELRDGTFPFRDQYEDIHMNVEARLAELVGDASGRLHTARSRNDQVATDFRLWVRDACDRTIAQLRALQAALLDQADANADALMPGFTHLQPAQPVTLGHHLMAYVEMFGRDAARFSDARTRMNESPLGAAALAGSPFPIDREATAGALGFDRPMANSLDAVSDRDFALESLAAASITAGHLSRLADMIETIRFKPDAMRAAAAKGFSTATDLADWLVRELGMPFRRAHHITGAAVKRAEALGVGLDQLPLDELQKLEAGITDSVYGVLSPEASVASRRSFGGTAPDEVRARIADWKERLA